MVCFVISTLFFIKVTATHV